MNDLEKINLKITQLEERRIAIAKECEDTWGIDIDSDAGVEWEYIRDVEYIDTILRWYRRLKKAIEFSLSKKQKGETMSSRPFERIINHSLCIKQALKKDIKKANAMTKEMKELITLCNRYIRKNKIQKKRMMK